MTDNLRAIALDGALRSSNVPSEVIRIAREYLDFLSGSPPEVTATAPAAAHAAAPAPVVATRKAATAAVKAVEAKAAAAKPAAEVPQAAAKPPAAAPAAPAPSTVPPPAPPIKTVADALVALVQSPARGGLDAAKALLAKYKVEQLAQIPGAKLAEFYADVLATGAQPAAQPASDPTGGLLG